MPEIEVTVPDEAPVMVLPNALLFPHCLMPLFIFEPRYREMLQWSLERDRVFCIALRKLEAEESTDEEDFYHTAGLGLVRACVEREDGTAHLMLQGLARVRFTGFSKTAPFFVAQLEALPNTGEPAAPANAKSVPALADDVRALCRRFCERGVEVPEGIDAFLTNVDDPGMLADAVAHSFLRDPLRRQELLEETNLRARLVALARHLRAELQL